MPKSKNEVALPIDIQEAMAQSVAVVAERSNTQGNRLTHKGGRLMFGEVRLPEDTTRGIVVDYGTVSAYFEKKYDPQSTVFEPPSCFAITQADPGNMVPHANVVNPQNGDCKSCVWAKFEHGPNANAPACKQRRRLMVIPALDNPERVPGADMAMFEGTPTGSRDWDKYVAKLGATGVPWWACITEIRVVPPKGAGLYDIEFEMIEKVTDPEMLLAIHQRIPEAREEVMKPYDYEVEG